MIPAVNVRICGLVATCALAAVAAERPGQARRFPIPGHGSIVLEAPQAWRVASKPLENPPAISIQTRPESGEAFSIQVSSVFVDPAQDPDLTSASLKERMQKSADQALPRSVEKKATLVELRGKQAAGYYYSLTDKESTSAPGDYKYMTQGSVLTGRVLTVFTILQHESSGKEKDLALRMLADAAYSPGETNTPVQQDPTALRIDETDRAYRLSVPVSQLVLTIPKGGFKRATTQAGGATASPRYFYFTDDARKLQLSGWFESADGFTGVKKFWEQEMASWRKINAPEPRDVSFTKIGKWDAIVYDVPEASGSSTHVRAHRVQAGTWIDLHVSTVSGSRDSLASLLETLDVSEKQEGVMLLSRPGTVRGTMPQAIHVVVDTCPCSATA